MLTLSKKCKIKLDLFGLFLFVIINFCSIVEAQPKIKIGASIYITGEFAQQGEAFTKGLVLAQEQWEAAAKKNPKPYDLELIIEDNRYHSQETINIAKKFINQDQVSAGITASFHDAKLVAQLYESKKIPLLVLWDSSPLLEEMGDYIFGLGTWAPSSGEKAAEFLAMNLSTKRVAIFDTNTEWSLSVSEYFIKMAQKLNLEIVDRVTFNPEEVSFKTSLAKVRNKNPEAVYAPIDGNLTGFFRQYREVFGALPIISSDVIGENFIREFPLVFEGVYQTQSAVPEMESSKSLAKIYIDKYHSKPAFLLFTAWAYDAFNLIAKCIDVKLLKKNEVNELGAEISECLYDINKYQGASGVISINREGSSKSQVSVFKIEAGGFKRHW